jgi:hypothetical protein
MRINRNMLLKVATDAVDRYVRSDHSLLAIYLQGSLLGDSPLIGNTADIDLFFVHNDEVATPREVVKVSDEVHLDISHHSHMVYRQPRELRVHPWLGPAVYGCKIMYDPQHFMDFTQASVRGKFANVDIVLSRVRRQAEHAREMWESFYAEPRSPSPQDASLYLHALEHAANAVAGLSGHTLPERRFLLELPARAEAVGKTGLYAGFMGLLGAPAVDAGALRSWLPEWQCAYVAVPAGTEAPIRLHPHRWLYYQRAIEAILDGASPLAALWPLWRTWTHAICTLPGDASQLAAWQQAGERLGLLGPKFAEKVPALDVYLDTLDELLEDWAREHGG